jgi:hypothetical protein
MESVLLVRSVEHVLETIFFPRVILLKLERYLLSVPHRRVFYVLEFLIMFVHVES